MWTSLPGTTETAVAPECFWSAWPGATSAGEGAVAFVFPPSKFGGEVCLHATNAEIESNTISGIPHRRIIPEFSSVP
jgi:hypothetical protein